MKGLLRKLAIAVLIAVPSLASAQTSYLIIPKGEWEFGAQLSHASFRSDDSEMLGLLLNPVNANASAGMFAPFLSWSYKDNRSIGLRFSYLEANVVLDDLTLDLLNDGLSFNVSDLGGSMRTYGATLYHRNFFGVDPRGRFGIICEASLGYGGSFSKFLKDGYSRSDKVKLSFNPGLIIFMMNNVSLSFSVGMANCSYNHVKCFKDGELTGSRSKFGTHVGVDILGINFGVAVHL